MKKFFKMGTVLTVFVAALLITACNQSDNEDSASIGLTGSNNGYYVKISGNLYTKGGLYDYWSSIYLKSDSKDCPAEFKIIGSSFSIIVFENQSLNNSGNINIYDHDGNYIGYVSIKHIDGKLKLTYQSTK